MRRSHILCSPKNLWEPGLPAMGPSDSAQIPSLHSKSPYTPSSLDPTPTQAYSRPRATVSPLPAE
ncbi:hypothetical protein EMIT0232MI5_100139 [Pseudomonas sp. IT-232MI5]